MSKNNMRTSKLPGLICADGCPAGRALSTWRVDVTWRTERSEIMIDKIIYGAAAILMIAAIAYGGSWLYQFLLELLKKTV